MKYLSVAIPCYNSESYMDKAIESCLVCKEDIEIIIVNDGSKDHTNEIGLAYANKYPDTIKYIEQVNGGHGEAVNTGLINASALYFKVLDSDDWFDKDVFPKIVTKLKELDNLNQNVDMFIANYIYDKPSENSATTIRYTNVFSTNKCFTWNDVGHFMPQQNILMHAIIYRTELLKSCNIKLPKHTFYVDNLFAFEPFPYVKTMYYMNLDLYHYYIGRSDQSVNEKIMISRIDQQLRVNYRMADCFDYDKLDNPNLKHYMVHYLTMLSAVSTILALRSNDETNIQKKHDLWKYLKTQKPSLYQAMKHTMIGSCIEFDSFIGRKFLLTVYKIAQKLFHFN